ncbi:MAG: alpha/beta hydrolase [Gallionella sp.]|nr:alpha/beta hydrolase [Gallionella sp.]
MSIRQTIRIVVLLVLVLAVYATVRIYNIWDTQRDSIFEPDPVLQTTPARLGAPFEELHIPSGNGTEHGELHAWWIPAEKHAAPTVLYLHGNARNIAHNLESVLRYRELGCNLLLVDYRGYGKSTGGKPSENKVYEDAEAAWQYLLKQRGVRPQQTFIYGLSLGSAIAVDLAVRHPEAAGLIMESSFTSMRAMGELRYEFLPVDLLLNQRFETLQKIQQLKIPVLLIHGTWDQRIPYEMSQRLYAAAPQPKSLLLIEGGEHSNSRAIGWVEYRNAVTAFIKQYAH